MSFLRAIYQWNRSAENSIIQDFDPDTDGNQTVNNNFTLIYGREAFGLSADGVIYGFYSSGAVKVEAVTIDFTNIPSGRYGLSLQVFDISGAFVGKSIIINTSLDANSISVPREFNTMRILVTVFDEVTGIPIDAVTSYNLVYRV